MGSLKVFLDPSRQSVPPDSSEGSSGAGSPPGRKSGTAYLAGRQRELVALRQREPDELSRAVRGGDPAGGGRTFDR